MKAVLKNIVGRTYKPFLEKYLSKKRVYTYGDIRLEIPPEVFHPGFFTSTQFLLQYIKNLQLHEARFLELGAGSGLISMYAATQSARVVASDINPIAVEYLKENSKTNKIDIDVILSNLFESLPELEFDIVAINPPYYKKYPQSLLDHAWYCGEQGEFFFNLFAQLPKYIYRNSEIIMVLCDGCDLEMVAQAAAQNKFSMRCVMTKQTLIEKNFIYKIEMND